MYKVIKFFTDLQDNDYAYGVGDIFPRQGMDVTLDRLSELASDKNKQGEPLIKFIDDGKPVEVVEEVKEEVEEVEEEPKKPKKSSKKSKGE